MVPNGAPKARGLPIRPSDTSLNITRIYVDADACPLSKTKSTGSSARHGLPVSVVAGNFIRVRRMTP